ncbi:MAG TPA: hypothetical protein VLY63_16585 [Anaerolineae bacterium]|nr:hypothetical protein [Anaerolineae bacterium]
MIEASGEGRYAAGPPIFAEYVSSHPDVKLVATDHGGLTEALRTLLEAADKGPDRDVHDRI